MVRSLKSKKSQSQKTAIYEYGKKFDQPKIRDTLQQVLKFPLFYTRQQIQRLSN